MGERFISAREVIKHAVKKPKTELAVRTAFVLGSLHLPVVDRDHIVQGDTVFSRPTTAQVQHRELPQAQLSSEVSPVATTATKEVVKQVYSKTVFDREYEHIDRLQQEWNKALGLSETKLTNYNPVFARYKFEQCKTEQERAQVRKAEYLNILTSLKERNHVVESKIRLTIDSEKKLRNELLSDEPFEHVLLRGVYTRLEHGTTEAQREWAEVVGYRKIQQVITNSETPIGTKFIVLSKSGTGKNTPYGFRFVDEGTLLEDHQGARYVEYVRRAVPFSDEEYKQFALALDEHYFDNFDPKLMAIDAWYLGGEEDYDADPRKVHNGGPIFLNPSFDRQKLKTLLKLDSKSMDAKTFDHIHKEVLGPYIENVLDAESQKIYNPRLIAESHHTLLSVLQQVTDSPELIKTKYKQIVGKLKNAALAPRVMLQQMAHHIKQHVRSVGAACDISASHLSNPVLETPLETLQKNSVSQFSLSSEEAKKDKNLCHNCPHLGRAHFHCETKQEDGTKCKQAIIVGEGTKECPTCGAGKKC